MSSLNAPKSYKLEGAALEIAKKALADARALQDAREALDLHYEMETQRLNEKMKQASDQMLTDLLAAIGVQRDMRVQYSIEATFLDQHNVAFLIAFERPDGRVPSTSAETITAPVGTRFN